jgi:hypothetical protein
MAWQFSVLVVANVTATSEELIQALKERAERGSCRFTLLVPAPAGGKAGREAAQAKLDEALARLREEGLELEGRVGDHDPIAAVHDVWDPMRWDEVVISTLPTGASKWLQVDLPHRVEKLTGVQVIHIVAEPRREVKTERAPEPPERYGVLSPLAALTGKRPERGERA